MLDEELCYRALRSRDARFDGTFVTAVTSTGIYCRPSCPAVAPRRGNVRFYRTAAAAQRAGFRACKRCRPDASPGSPEWNVRADLVGRAMRLIGDGTVDRDGVGGLAAKLGYTDRHVHRALVAEVGAGPQALARAQRAHAARILLETTDVPATDVAFAAGFGSVRQFNDTLRAIYAASPTQLRRRCGLGTRAAPAARDSAGGSGAPDGAGPSAVVLRLPYRTPYDAAGVFDFLRTHAVDGVEDYAEGVYRRTLRLPRGPGVVELTPAAGHIRASLRLTDLRDLTTAVQRCRALLDLDSDPIAVDGLLGADPLLGPLVAAAPGRRVPGSVDGPETAVRTVLGQQVSVAGARRAAARLVAAYGEPLPSSLPVVGGLTSLFPTADALAGADPAGLALPAARARAVVGLAAAFADGRLRLDPGADRDDAEQALLALPGIGPWTASYLRMRALGDPDVFLATDLAVRRVLDRLAAVSDARLAVDLARRWRPWRSYATCYLWSWYLCNPR